MRLIAFFKILHLFGAQLNLRRSQGIFQVCELAGANNGRRDARAVEFRDFAQQATKVARVATPPPSAPIFTDDRAPVERIVHSIILDFLTSNQ